MMPLGPQFMRLFDIDPRHFGLLVSVYTFAAAASGFLAAFWIDRVDRKRALLAMYGGFLVATALCGLAPNYEMLLAARIVAGTVRRGHRRADPHDRRRRGPLRAPRARNALVASAFSLSAVMGVPLGLWIATQFSWRAPFLVLAAFSLGVGLLAWRMLPDLPAARGGQPRNPLAQVRAIFGVPNHLRAFAFMFALLMSGFLVMPFIAPYNVANVGVSETDLPYIYFAGGLTTLFTAQVIGWLADRYGKSRVFTWVALASLVPFLVMTNLPRVHLSVAIMVSVHVLRAGAGALRPGHGARHGQRGAAAARQLHELQRRGPAVRRGLGVAGRRTHHRPGRRRLAHALRLGGALRGGLSRCSPSRSRPASASSPTAAAGRSDVLGRCAPPRVTSRSRRLQSSTSFPRPPRPRPDDHSVAARHRPLQVHDDAGRPASFRGGAGRVPLQVPQRQRRPDAVRGGDRGGDPRAVRPAVLSRRARLPAQLALLQERLRRPAGPLPPRRALHQGVAHPRIEARDRHHDQGAVAAHDPVRSAGARDRVGDLLPAQRAGTEPGGGARAASSPRSRRRTR